MTLGRIVTYRRLFAVAGLLALLTAALAGFSSVFGGGATGGSVYGGGVAGGSVFDGPAGTLAGGQFASIFSGQSAGASVTATGQTCNNSANAASVSCTMTVTAGNTVVFFGIDWSSGKVGNLDAGGCGDNKGNTYVIIDAVESTGGLKACYSNLTASGSTIFTWTPPGGSDFDGIVVAEFAGVVTASIPLDQSYHAQTSSANNSITTYPTTTAAQVVVVGGEWHTTGTLTCDAGYTQIAEDETQTNVSYSMCYKILSATGAQTHTWVNPNGGGVQIALTLSAAANGLAGSGVVYVGHQCQFLGGGTRTSSITCALPVKSGDRIVLIGLVPENRIGTTNNAGCSDAQTNTYTYIIVSLNGGTGEGVKICMATASASAVLAVTWTSQGGTGFNSVAAFQVAGATTTIDQTATNSGGSPNATTGTTATTTHANDILVAAGQWAAGATTRTCGAGYTEAASGLSATGISVCYQVVNATGAQSMTWTSTNTSWAAAIAALF